MCVLSPVSFPFLCYQGPELATVTCSQTLNLYSGLWSIS
jgi:hypothetical protein